MERVVPSTLVMAKRWLEIPALKRGGLGVFGKRMARFYARLPDDRKRVFSVATKRLAARRTIGVLCRSALASEARWRSICRIREMTSLASFRTGSGRRLAAEAAALFQLRRWSFHAVGVPFFAQGAGIGAAVHAGRAVDALVAVGVGIAASREAWFRRCSLAMLA